ncbi:MAG: regulatory protein GemA [Magnetococcus sp. MYC-9]
MPPAASIPSGVGEISATARNPLSGLRAKIHIAKKQLGMTDDEYRALLLGNTGKESTREMSQREMVAVLSAFVRLGWQPVATTAAKAVPAGRWMQRPSNWSEPSKNAMYRKLYALICANTAHGWNWGYVRGTAKNMFEKQKGDVVLEWLTGAELHALVSALQIAANRIQARP